MNLYALNTGQKLLVHLLHVPVVGDMIVDYRHLPPAYSGANVTHTVVETYLLVLIVRIAFAILGCVHHYLTPPVLISCNESPASGCGNHLVSVKTQHTVLAERSKHLAVEP